MFLGEEVEIRSSLSSEELSKRIEQLPGANPINFFIGTKITTNLHKSFFVVHKKALFGIPLLLNPLAQSFYGEIYDEDAGSRISGRFRLDGLYTVAIGLWLIVLLAIDIMALVKGFSQNYSDQSEMISTVAAPFVFTAFSFAIFLFFKRSGNESEIKEKISQLASGES